VGRVDHFTLPVPVALHQNGERPVLLVDALDLGGEDIRRLVPGDADILALAAVLGVALAVRYRCLACQVSTARSFLRMYHFCVV
jgi:hypothetical protein